MFFCLKTCANYSSIGSTEQKTKRSNRIREKTDGTYQKHTTRVHFKLKTTRKQPGCWKIRWQTAAAAELPGALARGRLEKMPPTESKHNKCSPWHFQHKSVWYDPPMIETIYSWFLIILLEDFVYSDIPRHCTRARWWQIIVVFLGHAHSWKASLLCRCCITPVSCCTS